MDRVYKSFQELYSKVHEWQQLSDEEDENAKIRTNSFLQKLYNRSRFSSSSKKVKITDPDLENFEGVSMFSHEMCEAPPDECYCVATAKYSANCNVPLCIT